MTTSLVSICLVKFALSLILILLSKLLYRLILNRTEQMMSYSPLLNALQISSHKNRFQAQNNYVSNKMKAGKMQCHLGKQSKKVII